LDKNGTTFLFINLKEWITFPHSLCTLRDPASGCAAVTRGVPQVSVLGPLLFFLFHVHWYADDTQLCLSTKPTTPFINASLSRSIQDIQSWVSMNLHKQNSSDQATFFHCSKVQFLCSHAHFGALWLSQGSSWAL
uniref:Reverse transcriptase domain-containing protein n=1 Tax=Esox lucius TaxID=8010 RepID=A0AAY5L2K9_ESOLU